MTYPSFSVGEVLTANDMNAVGLWLVKTQTIGTAVTTQQITNCFNSSFDNYRVLITGGVVSANGSLFVQLDGITTSVYQIAGYFMTWGGATLNAAAPAATTRWEVSSVSTTRYAVAFDVMSPQKTEQKFMVGAHGVSSTGLYRFDGYCSSTASATGFTLSHGTAGATFTGGTIRVYGYRN